MQFREKVLTSILKKYNNTTMLNNSIIHFSDASLIAVHALASLAIEPNRLVQTHEIARAISASEHHVAKVMQRLVRSRLVRSVKGPSGGFTLAKLPSEISFKDAIEAIDGEFAESFCPFKSDTCSPENCIFGKELSQHAHDLLEHLKLRTIADIGNWR